MRGVGAIGILCTRSCRFQHGLSHDAHVLTQSFHAAHQRGHGPCVQRLRAGGVWFGGAVANDARDRRDGIAGAINVVDVRVCSGWLSTDQGLSVRGFDCITGSKDY